MSPNMKYLLLTVGTLLTSLACQSEPQGSNPSEHTASAPVGKAAGKQVGAAKGSTPSATATSPTLTETAPSVKKQALNAANSGAGNAAITMAAKTARAAGSAKATQGETAGAAANGELRGPVIKEDAFSVWLQSEGPAVSGKPANVTAVLVAHPPYHCNEEYPHKFKFAAAPEGLSYGKKEARGMKVTAKKGVLAIPVQAEAAGTSTINGKLLFSVCTDERCLVEKQDLSLALVVK